MVTIKLTGLGGEHVAIIDAEDLPLVCGYNWYAARRGRTIYAATNITKDGRRTGTYMHCLIKPGLRQIDHHDTNGLNNRRDNLRRASHSQNGANQRKPSESSTPFKGVSYRPEKGKWRARITVAGRQIQIGSFSSPEPAARAYNQTALKYFGEFALLNDLPPEEGTLFE